MASTPAFEPQGPRGADGKGLLLAEQLLELAERAQSYTAASGATIALVSDGELLIRTSNGTAPEVGAKVGIDEGICGVCVSSGKPQICTDADTGASVEAAYRAVKIRSIVAIPVHCNKQVKAVLTVLSQMPNAFSRTHVAILMTLRDVIGAKLEESPEGQGGDSATATPAVRMSAPPPVAAPAQATPSVASVPKAAEPKPQAPKLEPVRLSAPFPQGSTSTQAAQAAAAAAAAPTAKFNVVSAPKTGVTAGAKSAPAAAATAKPAATPFAKVTATAAGPQPVLRSSAPVQLVPAPTVTKSDPNVLVAAEEPGSFVKARVKPATSASEAPTASLTVYGAKQPSGKGLVVGAIAGIAAVVVLGVALGLHFYHDHLAAVQAAEAHPPVVQTTPPAPVSAQPARLPEAPPPAAAANNEAPTAAKTPASETPLKAAPKSETGAGSGKPAKSEPTQSKLAAKSEPTQSKPAEEPAAEQEPVLHLTAAPAAKLHEGAEAPTLALASTADPAFPNLPAPKVKVNAPVSTIVPASLLRRVDPIYPQTAHNMSEDAVVKLTAIIAPSGDVASVTPLSGPMLFQVAAVEAVKRWKYKPATLNGKAVESTAEIVLKFAARR